MTEEVLEVQEETLPEEVVPEETISEETLPDETLPEDSALESVTPSNLSELKPKMKVMGKVQRLELYGAFIDIGVDSPAILHISQLGKDRVNRVADALNVGEEVSVWVDKVDPERGQVTVTMIEPLAVEWSDLREGQVYTGNVSRLEKFGAFIDIGAEKEGLVHISELSHEFVKHPSEVLNAGGEVQVKVLGFSKRKRRIDLSIKALLEAPQTQSSASQSQYTASQDYELEDEPEEDLPTAMAVALQQALSDAGEKFERSYPQGKKKGKGRKRQVRAQQDEILNRTLKIGQR